MGSGLAGCRWTDVEVVRTGTGPPEIVLDGGARDIAREAGIARIIISLSHDRGSALAFALAVGDGGWSE